MALVGVQQGAKSNHAAPSAAVMGDALAKRYKNAIPTEKYQVGVDAIALRFVMDNLQPRVVLSGASNENQLAENMKVMKFKLEKQELNSLRHHAIGSDTYWNERNKLQWN